MLLNRRSIRPKSRSRSFRSRIQSRRRRWPGSGGAGEEILHPGAAKPLTPPTLSLPNPLSPHRRLLRLLVLPSGTQGLSNQTPRRRIRSRGVDRHGCRLASHVLGLHVIPFRLPHLAKLDPQQWIGRFDSQRSLNRRRRDGIILRLQLDLRLTHQRFGSSAQHRFTNHRRRWWRLLGRWFRRWGRAGFDRGFRGRRRNGSGRRRRSIRRRNRARGNGDHSHQSGKFSLPGNHKMSDRRQLKKCSPVAERLDSAGSSIRPVITA